MVSSGAASVERGCPPVMEKVERISALGGRVDHPYHCQCSQSNYRAYWESITVIVIVLTSKLKWKEAQKGREKESMLQSQSWDGETNEEMSKRQGEFAG